MSDPLNGLIAALDLESSGIHNGEDLFTGQSQWMPSGRVFGGQVLAQSLTAAIRTVPEDRILHSMHGYFLRPGDSNKPITFAVDRIHEGRSFATRRTQAYQDGRPILSLIASFQTEDAGLEHQIDMPTDLPQPEDLPTTAENLAGIDHPVAIHWANERPFDVRNVETPVHLALNGERVAHQAVWMKSIGPLPDDPNLHRAALAYVSDYSILEPIFRRHGVPWVRADLKVASLDHAMWFHRFGRVDEWLLYVEESPSAQGGRGLSLGRIYTRDGVLIASVAQEGMIRVPGI